MRRGKFGAVGREGGSGWRFAGKGKALKSAFPGHCWADFVTPGRTRGQAGLLGSAGGAGQGGPGRQRGTGARSRDSDSLRNLHDATPGKHRCRGGSPRGPESRTLTDGQRDEGHLDEERQPAQHVHEPHDAPAPPAPRSPGRACALRLRRHGAATTAAASPPHGRETAVRRRREEPGPSAAPVQVRASATCPCGGPSAAARSRRVLLAKCPQLHPERL
jgi:hypothetical protein